MMLPTGTKKTRIKKRAGFTLVELILVILLLSVITAISSPLFKKTFQNLQVRNAALNMAKIAGFAREMAIIEGANYKLKIDPKSRSFWLTKLVYSPDKSEYKRIGGKQGRKFFLPKDVRIDSEKKEIIFYPDGRSDKAKINLTDEKQKGYLVLIKGFGSQIPVEDIE